MCRNSARPRKQLLTKVYSLPDKCQNKGTYSINHINVSVTLLLTGTELCIISCIIRAYNILVESTQSAIEITSCIQCLPRNLSVARPVLSDRYGKERENA